MSAGERLVIALAGRLLATLVRALGLTLRVRTVGVDALAPLWTARRPLIYAVWHGRILMVPWMNARLRRRAGARAVQVLASRSRDGELVTAFVRCFGLGAARGSSSRGGAAGLRTLAATLAAGGDVAVVPDGPRGPRERVQPGVLALAAQTGAPIVPLAFAARPARRLASWDRFVVPWPFARCAVVFGDPVTVARGADRDVAGKDLERALADVTAAADRLVGS